MRFYGRNACFYMLLLAFAFKNTIKCDIFCAALRTFLFIYITYMIHRDSNIKFCDICYRISLGGIVYVL